jgi:hypothetical protein
MYMYVYMNILVSCDARCDARVDGVNASALGAAAGKDVPVCVCMQECTCVYI